MFRYRGWLFLPAAIVILFLARPTVTSMAVGFAIAFLIGEGIRIWAVGFTGVTTRHSEVKAPRLITAGPYAYLRNPLYLGNLISWLGFCIAACGAAPMWATAAIFGSVIFTYSVVYGFVIAHEEEFLTGTFGEPFREYLKHVPAIIPRLKPYEKQNGTYDPKVILRAEIQTIIMLIIIVGLMVMKYYGKF